VSGGGVSSLFGGDAAINTIAISVDPRTRHQAVAHPVESWSQQASQRLSQ
jgi:hypothetical protein